MQKVNIDSQILDQMNRQIDLAYWLASIMITLTLFVIGYQVYINSKTISKLKKENSESLQKTSKKLFKLLLYSGIKLGFYNYTDLEEYLKMYVHEIGEDEEILSLLKVIRYKSIEQIFTQELVFSFDGPNKVPEKIMKKILSIENDEDKILEIVDKIELTKKANKAMLVEQVVLIKELFLKYGI